MNLTEPITIGVDLVKMEEEYRNSLSPEELIKFDSRIIDFHGICLDYVVDSSDEISADIHPKTNKNHV